MRNPRDVSHTGSEPSGRLARAVSSISGASARHPRTMVALWLVLIAGCIFAGGAAGTKTLSNADSGTGESARADAASVRGSPQVAGHSRACWSAPATPVAPARR